MPSKKKSSGADTPAVKAPKAAKPRSRKRAAEPATQGEQTPRHGQETAQAGRIRVKQVRSGIGHAYTYRRTLTALGLKHHQDEVIVADTPSIRGMLFKVAHLVSVRLVEA